MSETFRRAMAEAYRRMTEADRTRPCACAAITGPHTKAECLPIWHSASWHAGKACDCERAS